MNEFSDDDVKRAAAYHLRVTREIERLLQEDSARIAREAQEAKAAVLEAERLLCNGPRLTPYVSLFRMQWTQEPVQESRWARFLRRMGWKQ